LLGDADRLPHPRPTAAGDGLTIVTPSLDIHVLISRQEARNDELGKR
jgi:hypothetical protein